MSNYLIDTNIIIDYLRGKSKAKDFLESQNIKTISFITAGEIYQGAISKKELKLITQALSEFSIIPCDSQISTLALDLLSQYVLSHHLLILDAIIAATAIKNNLALLTGNYKHFSFISNLKVTKWTQKT